MALISRIPILRARDRGNQLWKARLTNWGNAQTGADAESLAFAIDVPFVGAQISSESDVGEVYIRWNPPSDAGLIGVASPAQIDQLPENGIYIRRGDPFFWRTPVRATLEATAQTRFGDLYYPSVGDPTATAAFGTPLGQVFDVPELNVVVFFDHAPPIVAMPPQPKETGREMLAAGLNDVAEHLVYVTMIQHRERVRVMIENHSDDDTVEVRLTGIRGAYGVPPAPGPFSWLREFPLFSTPFLLYPDARIEPAIRHPEAIWLCLYARKHTNTDASNLVYAFYADG